MKAIVSISGTDAPLTVRRKSLFAVKKYMEKLNPEAPYTMDVYTYYPKGHLYAGRVLHHTYHEFSMHHEQILSTLMEK